MQEKAGVLCSVHNCACNKDICCNTETISACCDNCVHPNGYHKTGRKSFRYRCTK